MAFLDEVADLIGSSTAGSTSWPVFRGHLPDSTVIDDRAIGLVHTGGGAQPGVTLQTDRLTVLVRGRPMNQTSSAYEEAEAHAVSLKTAVRGYAGLSSDTNDVYYAGVWCEAAPYFDGLDESYRPVFRMEFRCMRAR